MRVRQFIINDIKDIELQPHQAQWQHEINAAQFDSVVKNSWTVIDNNNKIVFIGGVYHIWENRLAAWSLISKDAGKNFKFIINKTIQYLNEFKGQRIECYVDPEFVQGHRFAKLLGFNCEALLMQKFHQNGTNASMYAKFIDL